jgi:hypothetical protein
MPLAHLLVLDFAHNPTPVEMKRGPSLALPHWPMPRLARMLTSDNTSPAVECPKCRAPMKLIGTLPKLFNFPELLTVMGGVIRSIR